MNNELKHYGIPGMRWGSRKVKNNTGSDKKTKRRHQKDDDNSTNNKKSNGKKSVKKALSVAAGLGVAGLATTAAVKFGKMYAQAFMVEGAAKAMKEGLNQAWDY